MLYEVEEKPKEQKKERAERLDFLEGFVLAKTHRLKARSRHYVPVLAGANCPKLPTAKTNTAPNAIARQVWATYWACLIFPWRKKSDFLPTDADTVLGWLGPALRKELGETDYKKARYVCNCSFAFDKDEDNAGISFQWRHRAAEQAIYHKGQWIVENGQNIDSEDLSSKMKECALLAEVAQLGEQDGETAKGRKAQMDHLIKDPPPAKRNTEGNILHHGGLLDKFRDMSSYGELAPAEVPADNPSANIMDGPQTISADKDHPIAICPELNDGQNKIRTAVLQAAAAGRQELFFLQGEAGTGKSHAINKIVADIRAIYGTQSVKILSPTGAAADNLGGGAVTIHRGASIGVAVRGAQANVLKGDQLLKFIDSFRGCFVVVIDEISMVSPRLLAHLSQRLAMHAENQRAREARTFKLDKGKEFGGCIVIAAGDFRQIPPVGAKSLLQDALEPRSQCGGLWRLFRKFELTEQMRAREPLQARRIEIIKSGVITEELISSIETLQQAEADEWSGATFLVQTNAERHVINEKMARIFALKAGVPIITWRNVIVQQAKTSLPKGAIERLYEHVPGLVSVFVQGAPAMITDNVNPAVGLANGSTVTLRKLCGLKEGDEARIAAAAPGEIVQISPPAFVLVENEAAKRLESESFVIRDGNMRMLPLQQVGGESKFGSAKGKQQTVLFQHHPVEIAFAITLHKCQGKTLDKVVLCIDERAKVKLSFEMFFVAISRVRHGNNLRIMAPLVFGGNFGFLKDLKPNKHITEWFDRGNPLRFDKDGMRMYDVIAPRGRGETRQLKKRRTETAAKAKSEEKPTQKKSNSRKSASKPNQAADIDYEEMYRIVAQMEEDRHRKSQDGTTNRPVEVQGDACEGALEETLRDIWEMRQPGSLMASQALDTTLWNNGARMPLFISGAAFRTDANRADPPAETFCTWAFHNRHFVALRVDTTDRVAWFKDSARDYYPEERTAAINAILRKTSSVWYPPTGNLRYYAGGEFEIREEQSIQQDSGSNDCAIFTANNIFEWLRMEKRTTREEMADSLLGTL